MFYSEKICKMQSTAATSTIDTGTENWSAAPFIFSAHFSVHVEEPLEQRNDVLCSKSEPSWTKECFEFRLGKHWIWIVRETSVSIFLKHAVIQSPS